MPKPTQQPGDIQFAEAIESGDLSAVKTMVRQHPDWIDHPDWTPPPLHCCVIWNQPAVATLLLDAGADMELKDPDRQTTPLRYAILYAKPEMVSLLITRGANQGAIVPSGSTALELAREAAVGHYEHFEDMPPKESYGKIVSMLNDASAARQNPNG